MELWYDLSNPAQVIFGYPVRPDTFARAFSSRIPCDSDIRVFLFVETQEQRIFTVSYSVVSIDFDGRGLGLETELAPPDRLIAE